MVYEGGSIDNPFIEFLELDIQASIGILRGHDAVNSRVCVSGSFMVVVQPVVGPVGRCIYGENHPKDCADAARNGAAVQKIQRTFRKNADIRAGDRAILHEHHRRPSGAASQ